MKAVFWALFAGGYFILAAISERLIPTPMQVPIIWPAAGVALGALLLTPRKEWLPILGIELVSDLAASLVVGKVIPESLLLGLINCLQTAGLAWILVRNLGHAFDMAHMRQVIRFVWFTILVCGLTSLASAAVHTLFESHPLVDAWFILAVATSLGTVLVTPVIITFQQRKHLQPPGRSFPVEAGVFFIAFVTFLFFSFFVFNNRTSFLFLLPYFIFPFLFWAAMRFGTFGTASSVLALAILAVGATVFRLGPFASGSGLDTRDQAMVLQAFLGIAAVSAYLVSAVFAERQEAETALRNSEESLRATMTNAPVIITQLDADGNIINLGRDSVASLGGQPADELLDQASGESQAALHDALQETFKTRQPQHVEITRTDEHGESRWYDVRFGPIVVQGAVKSVAMIATEITDRKRAEAALRESEERYTLAARGANDGVWDWDLAAGRIYFSQRWKALLGYKDEAISDSPDEWLGRIHPEDMSQVRLDLDAHLGGHTPHFVSEHRLMHRSGGYRWFLVRGIAVQSANNKPHRLAGSITDINSRKLTEERLVHDAMHDTLTSLANRPYFANQLQRSLDLAKRHTDYQAAVLLIDLDRFKNVNDTLGHTQGDQLLLAFGRRLAASMRPEDTVARLSGDEFGILLEEINSINEATRVANRVQSNLTAPFDLNGHEIFVTVSVGIILVASNYDKAADLLRDVELAMYQAKANGRARYQVFDKEMHARSMAQFHMESELRWAVERSEFRVYFQPIYDATSERITSLEALLRWQHPERGLLLPGEFIPLAEENGLIVPMGEWVLRTVCAQMAEWRKAEIPPIHVAINISARQLQDPSFPNIVFKILEETGVPGKALQVEITESAAMQDIDVTLKALDRLIQMGIAISLDDFGLRYSSLDYLKRFPVSKIKIDKSFVWDIPADPDDTAITSAIISVGHILNLRVVAEGVENRAQLEFLRQNKCDEIQGHFYNQAMTTEAATELLEEQGEGVD